MKDKFVLFLKISPAFFNSLTEIQTKNSGWIYYFTERDLSALANSYAANKENFPVVLCLHEKNKPESIVALHFAEGMARAPEYKVGITTYFIDFRIVRTINCAESYFFVRSISKSAQFDLLENYGTEDYPFIENSAHLHEQLKYIMHKGGEGGIAKAEQINHAERLRLTGFTHQLAQKDEYCQRRYDFVDSLFYRSAFQCDYERIIHAKAFGKMVDKAQVFSAAKGIHYRTRMTHSQVVAQIARRIGAGLKLNDYLVEAIALGHEIGHTPFGHQGERTIDDILCNRIQIIKNAEMFDGFGGFKHNYQSLRVLSYLEEKYYEIHGLNLSYQTLEGIWKHTGLKRDQYKPEEFIDGYDGFSAYLEKAGKDPDFPTTLEGQAVFMADKIAQRAHDIDDALISGHLDFEEIEKYAGASKAVVLQRSIQKIKNELMDSQGVFHIKPAVKWHDDKPCIHHANPEDIRQQRLVEIIIDYFVHDVIVTSMGKIGGYDVNRFEADGHRVMEKLIDFSAPAHELNRLVARNVENRVVNSPDVALFDQNASNVVRTLFKAYYDNPKLLPHDVKRRIFLEIHKATSKAIDLETCDCNIVRKELELISEFDLKAKKETVFEDKVIKIDPEEYKNKRKVLVRAICDYIAGMTDSHAMNEYRRILNHTPDKEN